MNDGVVVQWSDPIANGYVIHAYKVYIQQKDGATFTQEQVDCDGTDSTVVANRECTILLQTLRDLPYELVKDD